MKVLAINGSPRSGGNTEIMIEKVFEALAQEGVETEMIRIGGRPVHGCTACCKCRETLDNRCVIINDPVNDIIEKMLEADGILLGSPTYFADVTSEMKALIDRAGYVCLANGRTLKHKVGAAIVAVRRGGATHVFDTMNHFFQINQMFIVGSTYWNMCFGREKGEVNADSEGMANMTDIGESMALLIKKLRG